MATLIPCTVDTAPMAAEINTVSKHVMGTTDAVVVMQSAVIEAEKESADKVCTNVNRGFFTLMQSQISQKIASKHSRVEALLMTLGQQKRQLTGIKTNMEREYLRIAARYVRIFSGINKELESRIRQVDQPVFELVNKHMATSTNRMNSLTSWVSTTQSEGLTQSQQILVSKMKKNAQVALDQSTEFLSQLGEQRVITGQVLISNPKGNDDRLFQLPVVICETVNDAAGIARTEISTPDLLSSTDSNMITNTIRESDELNWSDGEKPKAISDEFSKMVDKSNISERVKNMMMKMYASADFKTI